MPSWDGESAVPGGGGGAGTRLQGRDGSVRLASGFRCWGVESGVKVLLFLG